MTKEEQSFRKKRETLLLEYNSTTRSSKMKIRLALIIFLLDFYWHLFVTHSNKVINSFDKSYKELEELKKDKKKFEKSIDDDYSGKSNLNKEDQLEVECMNVTMINYYDQTIESLEKMHVSKTEADRITLRLKNDVFMKIMKIDHYNHNKEATNLIKIYLIGMIPYIGKSTKAKILTEQINNLRISKIISTDKVNEYIERYTNVLYRFCVSSMMQNLLILSPGIKFEKLYALSKEEVDKYTVNNFKDYEPIKR